MVPKKDVHVGLKNLRVKIHPVHVLLQNVGVKLHPVEVIVNNIGVKQKKVSVMIKKNIAMNLLEQSKNIGKNNFLVKKRQFEEETSLKARLQNQGREERLKTRGEGR